jgi:aspartate kinase
VRAIRSEEVQIWTDIDGMHNNDPRIVKGTLNLSRSYHLMRQPSWLILGRKYLHPQSVFPAQKYKIPVRLLKYHGPAGKRYLDN